MVNDGINNVYLDNNATTPVLPEVATAVSDALTRYRGNPSSPHRGGDAAREIVESAREHVAKLIGCSDRHLVFTASATEGNNLAVESGISRGADRLITSTVEHASILEHAHALESRGVDVVWLSTSRDGIIEHDELEAALEGARRSLLAVQWVNNEVGAIQPVEQLVELAHHYGASVHIDATQAIGKMPVSLEKIDPDTVALNAHKINGPPGVGALYVRNRKRLNPAGFGGTQEGGIKPGTENIAGIAGFGEAARQRLANFASVNDHMRKLRDAFEQRVLAGCEWVHVNGPLDQRIGNTSNLRFPGIDGQALMAQLDGLGVYCSQTSACTNQRPEPSHVLRAMGLSEMEAFESVRFSTGITNTEADVMYAADVVIEVANKLRRLFA